MPLQTRQTTYAILYTLVKGHACPGRIFAGVCLHGITSCSVHYDAASKMIDMLSMAHDSQ